MAIQEEVNRACDAILARGERPTVDRVRTELGGGSPNRLTPLVRAWTDTRRQLALPTQNPAVAVDPSSLPPTLQRAITVLTVALDAAVAEVATAERRHARSKTEAILATTQQQIEEAQQRAQDERAATEAVRAEAAQLERSLSVKNEEIGALLAKLDTVQAEVAELRIAKAIAEQKAEADRQRADRADMDAERRLKERVDGEAFARDAIARAAKAEGEIAALCSERATGRGQDRLEDTVAKSHRSRTAAEPAQQ